MRRTFIERGWKDDRGAVAATVALSLFGLIAVGGLAFDYARLAALDTELQQAADQAALAAASQLDGQTGAIARATSAAQGLITNRTIFAPRDTVGGGNTYSPGITVPTITFYTGYNKSTDVFGATTTSDTAATIVQVTVGAREAFYALTPIVSALKSGQIAASAVAGVGSSVCKVPPIMICNPSPGTPFNANGKIGWGIRATGKSGGTWSPGNFGYLAASNGNAPDLKTGLAYQDAPLYCLNSQTGQVDTGNTAGAMDAANTRFDIYNFGNGNPLGNCLTGSCPAAANVTKDFVRPNNANGNNACKIHGSGWQLPSKQFSPKAYNVSQSALTLLDQDGQIDAMGLPRDNCHYTTYNRPCTNDSAQRFGDGNWARGDYFNKYHATGGQPSNVSSITRYETYLWEIANNNMPRNANAGGTLRQQGAPVCSTGTLATNRDRRIFSIAVVDNCSGLSGSSVPATITEWVDVFFVEPNSPSSENRGNGSGVDDIYLEIIGTSKSAGNGSTGAQVVQRSVPYLIR